MKQQIVLIACLCSAALVYALPISDNGKELDIINIPLNNGKELDVLTLGDTATMSERNKRTIGILRDLFPEISKLHAGDNSIDLTALNQQLEETIRVARQANLADDASVNSNQVTNSASTATTKSDQQVSESKAPAIDELSLDSLEDADGEDRNKRQGLLGGAFGGSSGGGGGGAGGATSGNFLFDIIRLFSGSVQSPSGGAGGAGDAAPAGEVDEDGEPKPADVNDGYTEGIPGPVTRLVVLANRGIANLIQDLILRVASTSERLVNFKARLITALI